MSATPTDEGGFWQSAAGGADATGAVATGATATLSAAAAAPESLGGRGSSTADVPAPALASESDSPLQAAGGP